MPSNRMPPATGTAPHLPPDAHSPPNAPLAPSEMGPSAPSLHKQYGNIGISAVAAAARYHGEKRGEGEVKSYPDERFEEAGK